MMCNARRNCSPILFSISLSNDEAHMLKSHHPLHICLIIRCLFPFIIIIIIIVYDDDKTIVKYTY